MSDTAPAISVIIVNWESALLTRRAAASIRDQEPRLLPEIVVVDNTPHDPGLAGLEEEIPRLKVIYNPGNFGFARGCNIGVRASSGEYVLLFNPDARMDSGILADCLEAMRVRGDSILGCLLRNPDGSPQGYDSGFPTLSGWLQESFMTSSWGERRNARRFARLEPHGTRMDWVTGAFVFTSKKIYLALGGLSEEFFMYGEDVDFCRRAGLRGIPSYCLPRSVIHDGGGSLDRSSKFCLAMTDGSRLRLTRKWHGPGRAFLLRLIFAWRSAIRLICFAAGGLLTGKREWRTKAGVHLYGLARLAGFRKIDTALSGPASPSSSRRAGSSAEAA